MKHQYTEQQYVQLAKEAFLQCMNQIPFVSDVEIRNTELQRGFGDFCAVVHFTDGEQQTFFAEVKSNGEKRFAKLFMITASQHTDTAYCLFMAPYISEATAEVLQDGGYSYMDLCGNCRILTRRIFLQVSGQPNRFVEKREKKEYLSKSASAVSTVLRTMLNEPQRYWGVKELSEASRKAIGTVSNVKAFLLERDWLEEQNRRFRIKGVTELLHTWSKDYHKTESIVREYYSLQSVAAAEDEISKWSLAHDTDAVLTGFSAAARYAPTVRYHRVDVYVAEQSLFEFIKDLELEPVSSGGNIVVTVPHDETPVLYRQIIRDSVVCSPVQTVIDLLGMPNRGEEAADAVILKIFGRELS